MAEPEVPISEQLIFNPQEIASLDYEMPPPRKAHWFAPCCSVERFGDGSPPVDHHWLAILVSNCEAAEVKRFGLIRSLRKTIDPAKDE